VVLVLESLEPWLGFRGICVFADSSDRYNAQLAFRTKDLAKWAGLICVSPV
jgi:hypothetical protein